MVNLGTYFEIPVHDMERAIKFYTHMFNVKFIVVQKIIDLFLNHYMHAE